MGGITALFQSMSAFTQGSPFAQNSFDIVAVARRATYAGMADNIETELNSLCSRGFWDAVWQLVLACLTPWLACAHEKRWQRSLSACSY